MAKMLQCHFSYDMMWLITVWRHDFRLYLLSRSVLRDKWCDWLREYLTIATILWSIFTFTQPLCSLHCSTYMAVIPLAPLENPQMGQTAPKHLLPFPHELCRSREWFGGTEFGVSSLLPNRSKERKEWKYHQMKLSPASSRNRQRGLRWCSSGGGTLNVAVAYLSYG